MADAPTPNPSRAGHTKGGTAIHRLDRSRATDNWYTPPAILDRLPAFDLDPCVPPCGASPWQRISASFNEDDDGLSRNWWGHVWLNPPYSNPGPWVERLADHGDGIALIFARTETGWWSDHVWSQASLLLFVRRRVSFVEPAAAPDRKGHNAPAPSVLVAYGKWAEDALRSPDTPSVCPRCGQAFPAVVRLSPTTAEPITCAHPWHDGPATPAPLHPLWAAYRALMARMDADQGGNR